MKVMTIAAAAAALAATCAYAADNAYKEADRVNDAAGVIAELMATPDKGIPQDLLEKAHCVVVIPGAKKGAFVVGAEYGRGFIVCRKAGGQGWGNPAPVQIEKGSVGFQIGGQETDIVMLVMNHGGMHKLLQDKFTLGADASVAAGPVGRTANAETDAQMHAEILAWSRSRGAFAGISLKGGTLLGDKKASEEIYGRQMNNHEIVASSTPTPAMAEPLVRELNRFSAFHGTDYRIESER
jgi:lipid-binding SYLF domain-containing protein